ncbi:hypothetical protein BCR34DRAFT_495448, partial [Clohesyomyces aquaticus]
LKRLHSKGVIYRDVNKYNILIITEGPKFINLEHATVCVSGADNYNNSKVKDIKDLKRALVNKSGLGQP